MKKQEAIRRFYAKNIEKWIPSYGILSLLTCLTINTVIYSGTQRLMRNVPHWDLSSNFDRSVPLVKEWVYIYFVCYLFWAANYILTAREGKEHWYRFATADIMTRIICGIFFIILPTTNVRPPIDGTSFSSTLMRFLYEVDPASNLFPSIHCIASWFCFIGIRNSKKIPLWYKIFSCVFALLVCASTQFTKQHYFIDFVAGIFLAESCYYIATHTQFYRFFGQIFDFMEQKVLGVAADDK